jgi:ankyrin repeat protein
MPDRELPTRPNLEQYKKQAKDLARSYAAGAPDALVRVQRHHPRFQTQSNSGISSSVSLTDVQLVLAREHGFESWPKFVKHIEHLNLTRSVASLDDPVSAFILAACVPRDASHSSGTLDHAEMILSRYPEVARANVHTAAILADEAAVRAILARDSKNATTTGGPHGWDALTHLCFSRYLRLDKSRSEAFVSTARALLEAGASANTGWYETIDHPNSRLIFESVMYGAAGIAQHPGLTRLLLERGADPNDEETPYHVPETYDNTVLKILLGSGKLTSTSLTWILLRKTDWHDYEGVKLVLDHGADPSTSGRFGDNALHHAIRRDNRLLIIELLLDRDANPALASARDGRSASAIAARRGRADILALFEQRGIAFHFQGLDRLIAACAMNNRDAVRSLTNSEPDLLVDIRLEGGTALVEFAGNNNVEGLRCLLDLGVDVAALHRQGDVYWDLTKETTALHNAAWRGWPASVRELIARGAPVNAMDGKGRTPLLLAIKACVDSYWTNRRSTESSEALLRAGATLDGIDLPTGYDDLDELLRRRIGHST